MSNTYLSDEQCDEFRRYNGSFNDMVRFIYSAGQLIERERCAALCESLGTATNGIYERNQKCADAIRRGE